MVHVQVAVHTSVKMTHDTTEELDRVRFLTTNPLSSRAQLVSQDDLTIMTCILWMRIVRYRWLIGATEIPEFIKLAETFENHVYRNTVTQRRQ